MNEADLFKILYYSLTGFYQPEYDNILPEDIYMAYIERKRKLINARQNKHANQEKPYKDQELLKAAIRWEETCMGFFKDKQNKRNYLEYSKNITRNATK